MASLSVTENYDIEEKKDENILQAARLLNYTHENESNIVPSEAIELTTVKPLESEKEKVKGKRKKHKKRKKKRITREEIKELETTSQEIFYVIPPDHSSYSLAIKLNQIDDEPLKRYEVTEEELAELNNELLDPYGLTTETVVHARRKRIFLFMVALDFFYCCLLLFVSFTVHSNEKKSDYVLFIVFLLVNILVDIIGIFGASANFIWVITSFIILEGITIGLYTFVPFSPLIILRLIIFLLALQVRLGMIRTAS